MDLHHRLARWLRTHPGKVDLFAAVAVAVVLVLPYLLAAASSPLAFVISTALVVSLAFRRTHVLASAGAVAGLSVLQVLWGIPPVGAQFVVLASLYTLASLAPRWASLAGLALAVGGTLAGVLRFGGEFGMTAGDSILGASVYILVMLFVEALVLLAWTAGDLARSRRLTYRALQDRARRLEVERQQERDLAAADERSHIAREMHDIVAHSLSVIIAQADGARYASARTPEVAAQTLGTISETGRASLREMRRLLGVLRADEHASTRPLPALADLGELLESVRRSGVEVDYEQQGVPRRDLPPGAELTAYRVAQESLTNVLKHAGARTKVVVALDFRQAGLEMSIDDDGRGSAADPATRGAGQGIVGMSERVALYDGRVEAAPRAGGGFRVHAFIPYTEA